MIADRNKFLQKVILTVDQLCKLIFNVTHREELENVFGISEENIKKVISKIVNTLPSEVFEISSEKKLEEIKNICAREFIFFQVQERYDEPDYERNLRNFIEVFSRDIKKIL